MPRWGGVRDVGEPYSWMLAIGAMIFSVGKAWRILEPSFYTSPYFVGILIGFLVHEFAHRWVARSYGLYSEFYASPIGLIITFATGFIPGLVILAPGYVAVYSWGYGGRLGWIRSVEAGPSSNIVLALLFLTASYFTGGRLGVYLAIMASINAWIALFNLLPVPPLDGAKISRADPALWAVLFGVAVFISFYV